MCPSSCKVFDDTHVVSTNGPASGDIRRAGLNLLCKIIAQTVGQVVVIELGRGIALIRQQMMRDIAIGWIDHCLELKEYLFE
jgi:hypothetical protein